MHPDIGPLSASKFGWVIAAILTGAAIVWSIAKEGMTLKQTVVVLIGCTIALLLGAKAVYLIEVVPAWNAETLLSDQVRLPGGLIAALALSPLFPRLAGRSRWHLADVMAPAFGLLILGTRIGCFLQGCCYGRPSTLPWALPFPRGSDVYAWQMGRGIITGAAPYTVPVQPLQLYFAIVGALLFLWLAEYRQRGRYGGQVALWFAVAYLWSTWLLEQLRAQPHPATQHFALCGALVATAVTLFAECRHRSARTAIA